MNVTESVTFRHLLQFFLSKRSNHGECEQNRLSTDEIRVECTAYLSFTLDTWIRHIQMPRLKLL